MMFVTPPAMTPHIESLGAPEQGQVLHKNSAEDETDKKHTYVEEKGGSEAHVALLFFPLPAADGHEHRTSDTAEEPKTKKYIVDGKSDVESREGCLSQAFSYNDGISQHVDGSDHSAADGRDQIVEEELPDRTLYKFVCIHKLFPFLV